MKCKFFRLSGLITFILLAPCLFSGCGGEGMRPAGEILKELNRLEGTWARVTRSGMVYEIWKKNENSSLDGMTWRVKEGDSVLTEKIRLFVSEDSLYYAAQVMDQNEGKEILFTLKSEGEEYLFENPGHDFPQRIRYSFPKEDELRVVIEDYAGEKRVFFNFFKGS